MITEPRLRHRLGCRAASLFIATVRDLFGERATTTAEQRAPELAQQVQPSASASAPEERNGAADYADTGTQEFPAERTSRPRRDR